MNEHDTRYYRRRLTEERERALQAPSPETSAVHRAFARFYQKRLESEPVNYHYPASGRG